MIKAVPGDPCSRESDALVCESRSGAERPENHDTEEVLPECDGRRLTCNIIGKAVIVECDRQACPAYHFRHMGEEELVGIGCQPYGKEKECRGDKRDCREGEPVMCQKATPCPHFPQEEHEQDEAYLPEEVVGKVEDDRGMGAGQAEEHQADNVGR